MVSSFCKCGIRFEEVAVFLELRAATSGIRDNEVNLGRLKDLDIAACHLAREFYLTNVARQGPAAHLAGGNDHMEAILGQEMRRRDREVRQHPVLDASCQETNSASYWRNTIDHLAQLGLRRARWYGE
jgi:hypothetical protein